MADAVVEESPGRFAVAGFSMGGCIALEVVARAPERVCCLALLSTSASGLLPSVRRRLRGVDHRDQGRRVERLPCGCLPPLRGPRAETSPGAVGNLRRYGQEHSARPSPSGRYGR